MIVADYSQLITECENHLRKGETSQAAKKVSLVSAKNVPRHFRVRLAQICARCGQIKTGLKILNSIVNEKLANPSLEEMTEYGLLLQRMGLLSEAQFWLKRVTADTQPKALLYLAICHFSRHDHNSALPLLQAYVSSPAISEYERLIGKVNLLLTYINLDMISEAEKLFNDIEIICLKNEYLRLYANCLELSAQLAIRSQEYQKARIQLTKADAILSKSKVSDKNYVHKWLAYIQSVETRSDQPLVKFKEYAESNKLWEEVRESDYLLLKLTFTNERFEYLFVGTPFATFRERLVEEFKKVAPHRLILNPQAGDRILVGNGIFNGQQIFKVDGILHRLFKGLLLDFYKPMRLGNIFSLVYPEERFNIDSSPNRVYQIVNRLKQEFIDRKLPLQLREENGFYRIVLDGNVSLVIDLESCGASRTRTQIQDAFRKAARAELAKSEISHYLELPLTSAYRLIKAALAEGLIHKLGSGAHTRYQLVDAEVTRRVA